MSMCIGYDGKRACCNRTGLGNYSRMVIGGVSSVRPEVGTVVYSPKTKGGLADGLPVAPVLPAGLWRLAPSLWRTLGVSFRLKDDGVGLFHGLSHELPLFLPGGVASVVTMHDLIVRRYPEYFHWIDRVIHRLKFRHACRVADIVVAISEQTRRDLVDFMGVDERKIRVVYQSCDPIFWNEALRMKNEELTDALRVKYGLPERYIICVGTVEARKNQVAAVKAVSLLPGEVGLVIVGRPRGSYPERVRAAVRECGIDHRVRFLEKADFADFPALYGGAVASVYMSRFEGFGIPVLESLCCDTPVVTSNVSSMPEAGGDAALYAAPDDYEAVAAHLRRLLDDDAFRRQVIEKGRTQRLRFAPEKVSQEMLALYEELLHD